MKKIKIYSFSGILLFLLLCFVCPSEGSNSVKPETIEQSIVIKLNCLTQNSLWPNEKCPLVVTFANLGSKTLYIPRSSSLSVHFYDSQGEKVNREQQYRILEPPPPPARNYIKESGKPVLMQPVWQLESLGGAVLVLPDITRGYRSSLKKGVYSAHIPFQVLNVYSEEQIMIRDDTPERYWVRADERSEKMKVTQNVVSIEFDEVKPEGTDSSKTDNLDLKAH